jgi:hypothetical protein
MSALDTVKAFVNEHAPNARYIECIKSKVVILPTFFPSFRLAVLPSFLPTFFPSFRRSFLPSFRFSVLPSCRLAFLPSFRLSFFPFFVFFLCSFSFLPSATSNV